MSPRFSSPPDPIAFNMSVWDLVRQVPPGKVATYGQIARLLAPPPGVQPQDYRAFAPRWVGGAMAACPDNVPWQRVINSEGKISPRRQGGEIAQRQLLEAEGVLFDAKGRVDLKRYQWSGPDENFAVENQGDL
jgi:methylated-DNA-protein-cysteine methyltransferase-like protein